MYVQYSKVHIHWPFSLLSWYAATVLSPLTNNKAYITFVDVTDRCSETMTTDVRAVAV